MFDAASISVCLVSEIEAVSGASVLKRLASSVAVCRFETSLRRNLAHHWSAERPVFEDLHGRVVSMKIYGNKRYLINRVDQLAVSEFCLT